MLTSRQVVQVLGQAISLTKHFTPKKRLLTPLKYQVFGNIMENGAFAILEQTLYFP